MHKVLVNRLGGLSLPRKSVVRLTDRPDMTLDVYRGRKTTKQKKIKIINRLGLELKIFKGFYHIWAWWPCWSCDLDGLNIFLFPQSQVIYMKFGYNWLRGF